MTKRGERIKSQGGDADNWCPRSRTGHHWGNPRIWGEAEAPQRQDRCREGRKRPHADRTAPPGPVQHTAEVSPGVDIQPPALGRPVGAPTLISPLQAYRGICYRGSTTGNLTVTKRGKKFSCLQPTVPPAVSWDRGLTPAFKQFCLKWSTVLTSWSNYWCTKVI